MGLDNYDTMKDLFMGMGRDIFTNKGIFEHYLLKTSGTEDWILRKAVDELLATSQSLPKINQVLMTIHKYTPRRTTGTAPCDICNRMGLVYSCFCYHRDGGRSEVVSYNHTVVPDAVYREEIIGRCKCENGMAYMASVHPTLSNPVDAPRFLQDSADESGMSCVFEDSECARYYNRKNKGESHTEKPLNKTLKAFFDKAIQRAEDPEEIINPMRASEGTKHQEDIFKEGDVPF